MGHVFVLQTADMMMLSVTSLSVIAFCLAAVLLCVDSEAVSPHDNQSGSGVKDNVESRLRPLMRFTYNVPTETARNAQGRQFWRALVDRQAACSKWLTMYRQRPNGDQTSDLHSSLTQLADVMRELCYELGVSKLPAGSNGGATTIVNSAKEAKRYDPASFDDYTDDSDHWGVSDHGDEAYGGDIGSPKGSWRQNVMRVWGK